MGITIHWFRRDLRLQDNAALYHALKAGKSVLPLFIFDTDILEKLPRKDARVQFIHQTLVELQQELAEYGASILVKFGKVHEIWAEICANYSIDAVYANHDYEPYARERDEQIRSLLAQNKVDFHTFKDQCIFEKEEILSQAGGVYTIFTPYAKKWKATLTEFHVKSYPTEKYLNHLYQITSLPIPTLEEMGFEMTEIVFPPKSTPASIIANYHATRDFPANAKGTSRLGLHLRFGTISIRKLAANALNSNEIYLNELIWRDFYMQILWHFPKVVTNAFKKEYDNIEWENDETKYKKWCEGKTGYALVDAGMRELNATGFMHNRVRMLVASFLTKHLLIDWRWGEMYFAEKLLDFDLAANNGSWQWAAGCGCDAAPYFRIFSPDAQLAKFDKELKYVRKWVPEFGTPLYPKPIIDHKFARERVLKVYAKALGKEKGFL